MRNMLLLFAACLAGLTGTALASEPADLLIQKALAYAGTQDTVALEHFQQAASLGDARGAFNLGWCYLRCVGTPCDRTKGLDWLERAARQGDPFAMHSLSVEASRPDEAERAQRRTDLADSIARFYVEVATRGDRRAAYLVAILHDEGLAGTPKDRTKAVEWYRKAAEQGYAPAQNYLGVYSEGEGVAKDRTKAVEWYRKAAEQGYAPAQHNLGVIYSEGAGVAEDKTKAVEWYRKAAEQGHAPAQYMLGNTYFGGEGVPKDPAKAAEWYRKAAEQGYAPAQNNLGTLYWTGDGVPADAVKAAEWYRKAAVQGVAEAQASLGTMHWRGEGVPADAVKAAEWYRKAADLGDAGAQYSLGTMHWTGEGVAKDLASAIDWFRRAADQGRVEAQYMLGYAYSDGEGLPRDPVKAAEWYRKAAEQGYAPAQNNLGDAYWSGEGVPKDFAAAFEWYQKAAQQGSAGAQYRLGFAYLLGQGVKRDATLAYAWYNIAAAGGEVSARSDRDAIERSLTADERAEGQRLASSWVVGQPLRRGGAGGTRAARAAPHAGAPDAARPPASELARDAPRSRVLAGRATAFVVSLAGRAVTNHHVVAGCAEVRISGGGSARVITMDPTNDLALLEIPPRPAATLAPPGKRLRQGEEVVVFGFPLEGVLSSGGNLVTGVVSALTGLRNNTSHIQITAPIQPGSSGSPVLDKKGHIVGVVSHKISDKAVAAATGSLPQNLNFAASPEMLRAFLDAHGVQYESGSRFALWDKDLPTIGEEARKWTFVVECWK